MAELEMSDCRLITHALRRRAAAALAALRAAVFPARCLHCRRLLPVVVPAPDSAGAEWRQLQACFCSHCLSAVTPVESPFCPCCGVMFKSRAGADHLCGRCLEQAPAFRMARAAFAYDRSLVDVIHCFKYKGKTRLAGPLGALLWRAYCRYWSSEPVDLILPVPLHRQRLRQRGFNQSELLLRAWKKASHQAAPPIASGVLVRAAATQAQAGLSRRDREVNIRGVFAVQRPELVRGRHLVVVDDVITTGATVAECARALLSSGAARVDVLALARVI
jgi:ComF family protein